MAGKHLLLLSIVALLALAATGHARDMPVCDRPAPGTPIAGAHAMDASVACPGGSAQRKPREAAKNRMESVIVRANEFVYRLFSPKEPTDETIVLLHGSGGDETTMVSLASRIAPHATLIGVRGRVTQDGTSRWYTRLTPTTFDQGDIRAEADAFARFLRRGAEAHELNLARTTFIGYSNGANLLGALTLLYPELVRRAVLLRPMPVLDAIPDVSLADARFLTVAGASDLLYSKFAPALDDLLRQRGARVDGLTIEAGHMLGDEDVRVVSEWLADANSITQKQ